MPKAICPVCEGLVTIVQTGERQGKDPAVPSGAWTSSQWWTVAEHFPPWVKPGTDPQPCEGSGKKV